MATKSLVVDTNIFIEYLRAKDKHKIVINVQSVFYLLQEVKNFLL